MAPAKRSRAKGAEPVDTPPWETAPVDFSAPAIEDIPIKELELPKAQEMVGPKVDPEPVAVAPGAKPRTVFQLPPTYLLQEPAARTAWDSAELKETAGQIKIGRAHV